MGRSQSRSIRDVDPAVPAVSLRPCDAVAPRAYCYLLLTASWRCVMGGVWDATSLHEAALLIREGEEQIDDGAFLYVTEGGAGGLWTGYSIVPRDWGAVRLLDEDRYMTTAQLMDAERFHAVKAEREAQSRVGTPIAIAEVTRT